MEDSMVDSDDRSPVGSKIFELYEKIHELVDLELMKFDPAELRMIQLVYGENFFYPINTHVDQLMTGAPEDEMLH
jgi:hypothetical protein